uniref:Distal membrane arm assembly complex 2-like protein n=1 Tax=Tetradesmus obliquus TaxID=3088 RepID=A0A383W0G3_TETOB|eukprot:jgi/Sobl393_1/7022/SZX70524.1
MTVCGGLVGLKGLKSLWLQDLWLVPGDVLALTALIGLTSLALIHMHEEVYVEAATSLVRSLTQLEYLNLWRCDVDLSSMALLAAVGQLKQLTYLNHEGNAGLTQQGLMQLTGLKRLQMLHVDCNEEVTDHVVDGFWAAVRQCV